MQPIDERRVRYLYEAATTGSIRAAADKLNMNPSVVSRQIAVLEEELAISLLERHGRGVKPTEAGSLLLQFHRQHNAHVEDVHARLDELRGLSRGHVDVVLGEGFVSDLMAEPIDAFWRKFPGLTLSLHLCGTNDVVRLVTEDAAHIGLVFNPPPSEGLRSRATARQPICAIVAADHPLAKSQGSLKLQDIQAYPVVQNQASYGTRQLVAAAEHMEKIRLKSLVVTNSISVMKNFVALRGGVAMLPAFAVSQEVTEGTLVALPLQSKLLGDAEAHVVTRLGRQLPSAANQLLIHLIASMKAFRQAR